MDGYKRYPAMEAFFDANGIAHKTENGVISTQPTQAALVRPRLTHLPELDRAFTALLALDESELTDRHLALLVSIEAHALRELNRGEWSGHVQAI